jgi:multiple sugar transport system substrate-binding protein
MTTEGGWMVNFMNQTYPNVQWKAVQIPKGPAKRADIIFTNAIGVNASTQYPKAAAALAMFITGAQNQADIVKTGFAYSTHPDQANLIQNPNDKAIAAGGLLPDSHPAYWGPYTGKLESIVSQALERVWTGGQSVQDSFNQAQQEATAALAGQ